MCKGTNVRAGEFSRAAGGVRPSSSDAHILVDALLGVGELFGRVAGDGLAVVVGLRVVRRQLAARGRIATRNGWSGAACVQEARSVPTSRPALEGRAHRSRKCPPSKNIFSERGRFLVKLPTGSCINRGQLIATRLSRSSSGFHGHDGQLEVECRCLQAVVDWNRPPPAQHHCKQHGERIRRR